MNQVIIRNGLYLINQQVTKGTQGAIACSPAAITAHNRWVQETEPSRHRVFEETQTGLSIYRVRWR